MAVWRDPRISRPPKLYSQNWAKNCGLICEYIRHPVRVNWVELIGFASHSTCNELFRRQDLVGEGFTWILQCWEWLPLLWFKSKYQIIQHNVIWKSNQNHWLKWFQIHICTQLIQVVNWQRFTHLCMINLCVTSCSHGSCWCQKWQFIFTMSWAWYSYV